jgi:hypothetical protein
MSFLANQKAFPFRDVRLGKSEFSKVCGELVCVKHDRCGCDAKRF